MLLLGDCLEQMKTLDANSVDAVVTDPPYGLAFMNKKWDYSVPSVDVWREVFRVLKPGGHVLSFGGTRTYHRMVVNIEDAGFEIRDQVMWLYGSGFPKSHNVSKAIDKMAGAEREVVGENPNNRDRSKHNYNSVGNVGSDAVITAPATPEAKQWDGWGSALKPANEPICLARKPLEKGLTLAENVLKWGAGGLNIDGCRIEAGDQAAFAKNWNREAQKNISGIGTAAGQGINSGIENTYSAPQGRWPANVLFDEDAATLLGEPSRFFYVAKASKRERNAGLEGMPEKATHRYGAGIGEGLYPHAPSADKNFHPTVKPIKLMEYLITLITSPSGTVLDPFMGSGSTGVAAKNLNRNFIGIEMNEEYFQIAKRRIEA